MYLQLKVAWISANLRSKMLGVCCRTPIMTGEMNGALPIFEITFLAVIYKTNCKQMINFMYHTSDENKSRFKAQESTFIIINCTLWVYLKVYFVLLYRYNSTRALIGC